jgi:nucleotide-binding universal stress UspA family protein
LTQARDAAGQTVADVAVDTILEVASPVTALAEESRNASVVVLGSRGLGGFTGLLVGSTAVELASRGWCPVVVVRGDDTQPSRTEGPVVVGVDGTKLSEAALEFAFAEAQERDTELVAVHAWMDFLEDAFPATVAAFEVPTLAREAKDTLTERLAGWQKNYPDVQVTREVVRGRPTQALLRFADEAQLVVVGSRGRGGFRGLLLGSTSQHLLRHAPCPVAVVRTRHET